MMLVFVSNFLNHHQIPLCKAFEQKCEKFYFIATDNVSNIGYQVASEAPFVVHYHESEEKEYAEKLIVEADIVIFGACPNSLIELRMKENKLSFLFSERFFKKGTWRRFIPRTRKKVYERIAKYKNSPMYVLCASAYLAGDLELIGYPRDKCYQWGYFPEVIRHDVEELFEKKSENKKLKLLWVARLIPLKHPEIVISLSKKLKDKGIDFQLDIVGDGELSEKLKSMIFRQGLTEHVYLRGSCTNSEVRKYMEQADIFYFTSDHREGWGAVLNEAMNSGCVVISSNKCGATQYLINDGENGYVFNKESELYNLTLPLIENFNKRKELGNSAYQTMINEWNSETAAERFLHIVEDIKDNKKSTRYSQGPCKNIGVN